MRRKLNLAISILFATMVFCSCAGNGNSTDSRQDSAAGKVNMAAERTEEGWINDVPSADLLYETYLETYDESRANQLKEELKKRGYEEKMDNFIKKDVCEFAYLNGRVGDLVSGNIIIKIYDEGTLNQFYEELEALTMDDPDLDVSREGNEIEIMRIYDE